MAWNKPKKVITNALVVLSIISLLLTAIAIITSFVWIKSPAIINKIDKQIPNFYVSKIDGLYEEMNKMETMNDKYIVYKKINIELDGISSLDRYYPQKQDAYKFLINYLVSKNQNEEALAFAKTWKEQNDYDFEAKFYYADTLKLISKEETEDYYASLYSNHKDIIEIAKSYIEFLVEIDKIEEALVVENEFNRYYNRGEIKAGFRIYYLDADTTKYTEKSSISSDIMVSSSKNKFTLTASKTFNQLTNLRFDINNVGTGTRIKNLRVSINNQNIEFKLAHHLNNISSTIQETTGNDPFYYLLLPDNLKKSNETLKLNIYFNLDNQLNIAKKSLMENKTNEKN